MADTKNIGLAPETYERLLKIQEGFKQKHNSNKTFDQIVVDLLDGKKLEKANA